MVAIIVGKGGETIKRIKRESSCHVAVTRELETAFTSCLTFMGDPSALLKAQMLISMQLSALVARQARPGPILIDPAHVTEYEKAQPRLVLLWVSAQELCVLVVGSLPRRVSLLFVWRGPLGRWPSPDPV